MPRNLMIAALVALTALSVGACGRSAKQTTTVKTTTTGQELVDLQAAYDEGLIDQKEFERKRKAILTD